MKTVSTFIFLTAFAVLALEARLETTIAVFVLGGIATIFAHDYRPRVALPLGGSRILQPRAQFRPLGSESHRLAA